MTGYVAASRGPIDTTTLLWTTLGTALAALGANAFNQVLEREADALMERTKSRPLPSGRMDPVRALTYAAFCVTGGIFVLATLVNWLTAALALLIEVVYLFIYTPMKRRSPANTLVGAVCGAIPPMMGWTAVRGSIDPGAWLLFLILFVWQMPHFLSLAWLYREDYARGGYRMLPTVDPTGRMMGRAVVLYSATLLPLAIAVLMAGLAGWIFLAGAVALAVPLVVLAIQLNQSRSNANARRLFFATLIYLPLLFALLVADRGPVFRVEDRRPPVTYDMGAVHPGVSDAPVSPHSAPAHEPETASLVAPAPDDRRHPLTGAARACERPSFSSSSPFSSPRPSRFRSCGRACPTRISISSATGGIRRRMDSISSTRT